jgi:hypothetical protein
VRFVNHLDLWAPVKLSPKLPEWPCRVVRPLAGLFEIRWATPTDCHAAPAALGLLARLLSPRRAHMRVSLSVAMIVLASGSTAAEPPLSIEQLLSEGWEIAGYASGYDNRTSLILFRHAGKNALVQCGVLYDVTRNPHTIVNCYELR